MKPHLLIPAVVANKTIYTSEGQEKDSDSRLMSVMRILQQLSATLAHCLPNPEASIRIVSVKDTNPLIAEQPIASGGE